MAGMEERLGGMETRLGGKMDSLETTVTKNKESIVVLTDKVNKTTIDLARFESQLRDGEEKLESKVTSIVRGYMERDPMLGGRSLLPSSAHNSTISSGSLEIHSRLTEDRADR